MMHLNISMYHYTRDLKHSRYPEIKGLDLPLFKQQLDFFEKEFSVVRMKDVIEAVNGGKNFPENALLLTFDDGYIDNFTVAFPLIMEHMSDYPNIPPYDELYENYAKDERFDGKNTVFCKRMLQTVLPEELRNKMSSILFEKYVVLSESDFSRKLYMNRDQIRLIKKSGMFIGFHGYDHYWLANFLEEQMHRDVDKALEVMDEFIDRDAWVMNYPYDNHSEAVISHIKGKGCVLGLTTELRVVDLSIDDRYKFPRLDCNDFPPKSKNYNLNSRQIIHMRTP